MNPDLSAVWAKLEGMIHGLIALLPNFGVAIIVFALFYVAGKGIKALVMRVTARRRRQRSLGVVLGRLSQWGIGFVGLLVAFSILLPSFKAGDLIQLLGIGSAAIGFAFRDIFQNFLPASYTYSPSPSGWATKSSQAISRVRSRTFRRGPR
jgi:small conductance mechanosensitive channel